MSTPEIPGWLLRATGSSGIALPCHRVAWMALGREGSTIRPPSLTGGLLRRRITGENKRRFVSLEDGWDKGTFDKTRL